MHESHLRRIQQHHCSGRAANQAGQAHQQRRAKVLAHVLAIRGDGRELARPDRHRVSGVGLHRKNVHPQEGGKRQKRPTARYGVQHTRQKCGHYEPNPTPVYGCCQAGKIHHSVLL